MKKTSTPDHVATPHTAKGIQPKASTLAFIRQFARAYSFEPKLQTSLGGLVNN